MGVTAMKRIWGVLAVAILIAIGAARAEACSVNLIAPPNETVFLRQGDCLWSPDAKWTLIMQPDGNLVEYWVATQHDVWDAKTSGHAPSEKLGAALQKDGNLVIYDAAKSPIFASGKTGTIGLQHT